MAKQVTGNEAQFNEKVTFLKNIAVNGDIELQGTITSPTTSGLQSQINNLGTTITTESITTETITATAEGTVSGTTDLFTFQTSSDITTVECLLYFQNGANIQTEKVLAVCNSTNIYSQEYAISFEGNLIVSVGSTTSGGSHRIQAVPETGITGTINYKILKFLLA